MGILVYHAVNLCSQLGHLMSQSSIDHFGCREYGRLLPWIVHPTTDLSLVTTFLVRPHKRHVMFPCQHALGDQSARPEQDRTRVHRPFP